MMELDERLTKVARAMTEGIEVADPSAPSAKSRRPDRTVFRAGAAALVSAAAVAVAVLVWAGGSSAPTGKVVAIGGDGAGNSAAAPGPAEQPRRPGLGSPVDQFRAAVEAALAGGVTVRIEHVESAAPVSAASDEPPALPVVSGSAGSSDVWTTIDGPLEASTSPVPLGRGRVHLRDTRDGRTYWQVGPGQWQRASFDEPSLAAELREFAASPCITTASGRGDQVFVTTGSDNCVEHPLSRAGGPDHWVVTMDADGRLASIEPVEDPASPVPDVRSALTFEGHGSADVELPAPSAVADVSPPRSWGVAAATGWAVLSAANG